MSLVTTGANIKVDVKLEDKRLSKPLRTAEKNISNVMEKIKQRIDR